MYDCHAKRKAPWGTGAFFVVNIFGDGSATSLSVDRSMGRCGRATRITRISSVQRQKFLRTEIFKPHGAG
jgi:hypothetical protein